MKRSTLKILALSLASGFWLTGCEHTPRRPCDSCSYTSNPCTSGCTAYAETEQQPLVDLRIAGQYPPPVIAVAPSPLLPPPATVVVQTQPAVWPQVPTAMPVVVRETPVAAPVGVPLTQTGLVTLLPPAAPAATAAPAAPAAPTAPDAWSAVGQTPAAAPEPSLPAPSTASVQTPAVPREAFSHSEDYSVLTGSVQPCNQGWRLRYAPFDTEDQHGGCVVLEGGDATGLQDGCQVHVEGKLIPSPERNGTPTFEVRTLDILQR